MQSLRARYFYDFRCVAYRVYNNYAHATRLIESFFFIFSRRRGPFTGRPNNSPPRVFICAFHTFVYRRCVRTRARMREKGDTILRREKQHRRTERERWRGKRRRTIFSLSFRLSLFLSRIRVSLTRRTLHCERGMRCERREFPVVNVFGCNVCLSLLSSSHARAPIKAPRIKVTAPFP